LENVRVDKGDAVEKGQLLAAIESPETNQDYDAADADARNKRAIAERYKPLLDQKLVSQQEADQAFADANVAEARLKSLGATKGYEEIRAPFAGTVTARYVDPGALVQNAQTSQTSAQPLFTVSQLGRLRVYVYVDQSSAIAIHPGLPVRITLDERPDVQLDGTVTRLSGELDPRTRLLLTEVDIDNRAHRLVAGSFVKVSMKVQEPSYLQVPSEALVLRQNQDFVPVVTSSQTVSYRPVRIADNDGEHVRLLSGVSEGELVALNLGNSIEDGSLVQPIPIPASSSTATPSASAPAAAASSKK
ncbi:MAG TPA: efflux RND transporter periplasmic adaptor subunit, partial [Elusimicrobiota bacterium]|nr:efflux RND transporter periplasmic adaptor subunit [Elusimicrobiota bacterium]